MSVYRKTRETWNIDGAKVGLPGERVLVEKLAVRDRNGRFHGATNFRTLRSLTTTI